MKINRNKNPHYNHLLIALVVLTVLAAGSLYFYLSHRENGAASLSQEGTLQSPINFDTPTNEQIKAGTDSKKQAVEKDLNSQSQTTEHKTTTLTITSSNINAGKLQIRALIQDVVSDGTCTLTMTNSTTSTQVVQTADTQALPGGSACRGFDVELAQLSDSPAWNIHLTYSGSNYSGDTTKDITVSQ